jgi:ribose transport system substrate-binding protein
MRWIVPGSLALIAIPALLIAGCGAPAGNLPTDAASPETNATGVEGTARAAGSKGTVGVSVLTLTNPFFRVIGDNIAAELEKAGYDTVVVSGEFDVAAQRGQVKDFITAGHSAIVLCPCDSRAVGAAIREANEAGIPVFTADLGCLDPDAKVESHIATDNYSGGKQAGEAMIEALGEAGGKVVILDFAQAESCNLRVKGFKEVIAAHNAAATAGQIEIVAELPGNGKTDEGYKAAEDALQSHADLAGIFAINDPSALGAWAALDKAGKAGQVKLVGFDGQPDGKQAIKDGKIFADPIQHPDQIGKTTAQSILKYLAGEEVEKQQLIPTALYRQADGLADPELK